MIKSKEDLQFYMESDRVALRVNRICPRWNPYGDLVWKYERALRKAEYYNNVSNNAFMKKIANFRLQMMGSRTGFQIGLNTCGAGLSLAHCGTVIINRASSVGENCRIQTGVTLGTTNGSDEAPKLGNNVFLGEGAKVIGNVSIADDVAIVANAVVVKDITESGTTWGGVPAKKISEKSSASNVVLATKIVRKKLHSV